MTIENETGIIILIVLMYVDIYRIAPNVLIGEFIFETSYFIFIIIVFSNIKKKLSKLSKNYYI